MQRCVPPVRAEEHTPSGLASTGYPEPLRAASGAPTPPSQDPGSGIRGAPGSGQRLRPRHGPAKRRCPRRYQRGSGWLRPGDGVSALALRVMRACSPHEPLSCSPPGRLSRPGRHTGGQLNPARVRRGALHPARRDSH